MMARLSDDLDGPMWKIGPITRRTRQVTYVIEYKDPEATAEDTELAPDNDPNHSPEDPEAPEQEALVNRDN